MNKSEKKNKNKKASFKDKINYENLIFCKNQINFVPAVCITRMFVRSAIECPRIVASSGQASSCTLRTADTIHHYIH